MSFPAARSASSSSSSSSSIAAAFSCERLRRRRLRRLRLSSRHQSDGFDVGCRLRRRVSSSSSSSAREERSAKSDDDDDRERETREELLLLLREQLQQRENDDDNDDDDDDDVRFVCLALLDDEGAFFSSTTTMDSLDDDAPGTFAVLLSSPLLFCSSEKEEEEEEEEEEARRLCWTRLELKSTKRLKEDAISSLRAVSMEQRTKNNIKEEENRLVAVAYKPLAIGARKKVFRDAEKYFEETFSVSSSWSWSSSTTSEEKVENGRGSGDVSSSSRSSSSSSSSSSTRGLFSSEDVKQLETYGFVVLDGVVPEQAVRQMYEHAESLADKLFPVDQDGRDDDLASIKIDIENPAASPLNLAGTFLWSLPRKLCEAASASSYPPPNCALAARARAENTALDKFAQLAKYDKRGARYDPHVDYDHNNSDGPEGSRISERNLTAILYFNVGYASEAEGCLRVFLDDREEENRAPVAAATAAAAAATLPPPPSPQKYVDVEPLPGRLVVFDSRRILHGVMPSYRRRWAITVWS